MLVLLGPTAVGKSAVALALARREKGEIISCDSMQVYRGMNIGTAKPLSEEREEIPHHLIDITEPEERYDVARFLRDAETAVAKVKDKERFPILAGGTPMYLKAFLFGIFEGPPADQQFREKLKAEAEENGSEALWKRLEEADPEAAGRIHPNDLRRIVRALEVHEKTGIPISTLQKEWDEKRPARDAVIVGLDRPREILYRRVDERVDGMLGLGFVDEVRRLKDRLGPTASRALGYAEMARYLDGGYTLEEAVQAIKNNTHNFVRKQMTWYRSLGNVNWFEIGEGEPPSETAEKILASSLLGGEGRVRGNGT